MSELTILQKNGITNMVCKNEDCHTPETNCPCTIIDQCECPTLKEVIETLAHYKDLEEQGRLIEQKHRRWMVYSTPVYHEQYGYVIDIKTAGICSNCGQEYTGRILKSNYCPNCGAKME